MTTCHQGNGLFVIHRHAGEGLTNITTGGNRIRLTVWSLWIDVDQAHLYSCQWIFQFTLTLVALVGQPFGFCSPVDVFFWFPNIGTSTTKAKGLEAHGLHGAVSSKDHQVSPRDLVAILLLDWPQQASSLVKIGVVWPAIERGEALLSSSGSSTTVSDPVGTRAVPGHAYHEGAIVSVISGPPLLRVGH